MADKLSGIVPTPRPGAGGVPRAITRLFSTSRPAAILRGVVPIVINAVNRVSLRRPLSHIRQKCAERIPTLTNTNAASSVPGIARVSRVVTAAPHRIPRGIGNRSPTASFSGSVLLNATSTAPRALSTNQVSGRGQRGPTAFTLAYPAETDATVFATSKNLQLSELLTDQISRFSHLSILQCYLPKYSIDWRTKSLTM